MKLIFCLNCGDVVKMIPGNTRTCLCGQSGGTAYQDVDETVEYWGGPEGVLPLGLKNSELTEAMKARPKHGRGSEFTAFVIPEVCLTMREVDLPTGESYDACPHCKNILEPDVEYMGEQYDAIPPKDRTMYCHYCDLAGTWGAIKSQEPRK